MWQPIETLPKDELVLLFWHDGIIRIGQRWADTDTAFKFELDFGDFSASVYCPKDYLPTHWMSLPYPPTDQKA